MEDITGRDLIRMQLKRMREAAGLTIRELATELHWSKSILGAVETGDRLPKENLAAALDEKFNPTLKFTELLNNVRDALVAEHMRDLLPQELKAVRIQAFTSSVVPGLLQTMAYAHELSRKSMPGASHEEITARVTLRVERQEILDRKNPPFYWVVIHESALMASSRAMLEQLRKLEQSAMKHNVTLQIYPMAKGLHGMMGGSLALWHLEDGRTVALVESFGSGEPIESPSRVAFYSEMFDQIKVDTLSPDDSLELIRRYIKDHEND